jgi:cytochrome c oxidase assembly protein subunit 15
VVIFHLQPPFVMGHFILSLVLLWNALVLYKRAGAPPGPARLVVDPRVRTVSRALLVAVSVVVVTGTVVTATGPHGGDEDARRFGFEISSVARIHGISVTVFVALTLLTLWMVQRLHADDGVRNRIGGVLFIALAQAAIGYIQYLNDIPALLVGMHVAGATALWAAVVWFHLGLFVRDPEPSADATGAPDRPDRERLQPA